MELSKNQWKLLVKFGGKRLYAVVCQAVADGKMSPERAAIFLDESVDDIKYCVEEIESVLAALDVAIDNGVTVNSVMAAE
jgi:hypothetical protein